MAKFISYLVHLYCLTLLFVILFSWHDELLFENNLYYTRETLFVRLFSAEDQTRRKKNQN